MAESKVRQGIARKRQSRKDRWENLTDEGMLETYGAIGSTLLTGGLGALARGGGALLAKEGAKKAAKEGGKRLFRRKAAQKAAKEAAKETAEKGAEQAAKTATRKEAAKQVKKSVVEPKYKKVTYEKGKVTGRKNVGVKSTPKREAKASAKATKQKPSDEAAFKPQRSKPKFSRNAKMEAGAAKDAAEKAAQKKAKAAAKRAETKLRKAAEKRASEKAYAQARKLADKKGPKKKPSSRIKGGKDYNVGNEGLAPKVKFKPQPKPKQVKPKKAEPKQQNVKPKKAESKQAKPKQKSKAAAVAKKAPMKLAEAMQGNGKLGKVDLKRIKWNQLRGGDAKAILRELKINPDKMTPGEAIKVVRAIRIAAKEIPMK